jgi:hypothetical protein
LSKATRTGALGVVTARGTVALVVVTSAWAASRSVAGVTTAEVTDVLAISGAALRPQAVVAAEAARAARCGAFRRSTPNSLREWLAPTVRSASQPRSAPTAERGIDFILVGAAIADSASRPLGYARKCLLDRDHVHRPRAGEHEHETDEQDAR